MAKKKVNDTRANIESGMYFKFKEIKYRSYTKDVYNIDTSKNGHTSLNRYHCHHWNH